METMSLPLPLTVITSNAALAEAARDWAAAPQLALDTEFVRESTFRPIAGLIQVGTDRGCWLLDPLTIDAWQPLCDLFENEKIPKVTHACGEDLELFLQIFGTLPTPLYDTQVGAALAGLGYGLSYQALVDRLLGIAVEKDHTRSNWVARPLTEAQQHYAALDVAWLGPVFRQLAERLGAAERMGWWREEGERLLAAARSEPDPEHYYLRLGAGWRLRGVQVAALQRLCAWREREARRANVPRGWLLKDHECLEIARRLPRTLAELLAVPELNPRHAREQGATVLALLDQARALDPADWPPPAPPPLDRAETSLLRRMRSWSDAQAETLGIAPELLVRKRDCEQLLRTGELPPALRGWRLPLVADRLLTLAAEADDNDRGEAPATTRGDDDEAAL